MGGIPGAARTRHQRVLQNEEDRGEWPQVAVFDSDPQLIHTIVQEVQKDCVRPHRDPQDGVGRF